jgi:nucleotidyltransferase AbiEii toxin of type IV toxin-antitoxin system
MGLEPDSVLIPRLDVLPPSQRRLWADLDQIPSGFVLYGGTALALRLGHRTSEDFDFFSNALFQPDELERRITFLTGAPRLQSSPNTLVSLVEREGPVKISFFGGLSLRRVGDPEAAEGSGVLVASLLDLAATKVKVVQDRAEAKDYVDLHQLLTAGVDLAQALGAARAVWGDGFNALLTLKALSYFADGDLPSLPETVRSKLTQAVRNVDLARLPEVQARGRGVAP